MCCYTQCTRNADGVYRLCNWNYPFYSVVTPFWSVSQPQIPHPFCDHPPKRAPETAIQGYAQKHSQRAKESMRVKPWPLLQTPLANRVSLRGNRWPTSEMGHFGGDFGPKVVCFLFYARVLVYRTYSAHSKYPHFSPYQGYPGVLPIQGYTRYQRDSVHIHPIYKVCRHVQLRYRYLVCYYTWYYMLLQVHTTPMLYLHTTPQ